MAVKYLRSTDGSDSDDGTTWALAKSTLSGLSAVLAAGDTGYISDVHDENNASANISVSLPGTVAAPVRLICGDDAAAPPTTLTATGSIKTTGAFSISVTGSCYADGLILESTVGSATSNGGINLHISGTPHRQEWANCKLRSSGTNNNHRVALLCTGTSQATMVWKNTTVKFGTTSQGISLFSGNFHWNGGGLESGTSAVVGLFKDDGASFARAYNVVMENLDLSAGAASMDIFQFLPYAAKVVVRNVTLPNSWVGDLNGGTTGAGARAEMYDYKVSGTVYPLMIDDHTGRITGESTICVSGETLSFKMVSNASALYPHQPLRSSEIYVPIVAADVGVSKTITVELVHDSATALKDDEVWLECEYPTTSPPATHINDRTANVLTTSANQASSAATWTTTGLSSPNTQKVAVTFTPDRVGTAFCRVALAKASKTIYVSPEAVKT